MSDEENIAKQKLNPEKKKTAATKMLKTAKSWLCQDDLTREYRSYIISRRGILLVSLRLF